MEILNLTGKYTLSSGDRQKIQYAFAAIVAVITFAVNLQTLRNGFVNWDDDVYIYNNLHIRFLSIDFFRWAFFKFYAGNWHPLTWISHALDYAIWGLNPMGHHLTNIILHSVNTFMVVVLVIRIAKLTPPSSAPPLKIRGGRGSYDSTGDEGGPSSFPDERSILITAGITGLLFGLHPLHVESVAWVSERKDLLCALFFLTSILSYMSYRSNKTYMTYFLALGFFILALMSKPMAITLPAILLILDWYPLNRFVSIKLFRAAFIEKMPFLALSLGSAIVTVLAQKSGGAIMPLELYPLSARLLVGVKSVVIYLWKLLLPVTLLPYYAYPRHISFLSLAYFMPALSVAVITTGCILISKKRPLLLAVWGYYVIMLIPVLGFVQVGNQSMADRYTYLPGLGPFLLMGLAAAWVWAKADSLNKWGAVAKGTFAVVSIALVISLVYLTVNQTATWRDSLTLWTYVIEKAPDRSSTSYINRGLAYIEAGQLELALNDFNAAIALEPDDTDAYNNRGIVLKETGRPDQAIGEFNRAITIDPARYITFYNRGTSYKETGRYDLAMDDFNKAISLNPSFANVYVNRGLIFEQTGQPDRALEDFNTAIRQNPLFADAYTNRGLIYEEAGQFDRALEDFNTAIRLNPSGIEAYNNRGLVFEYMGHFDRAIDDYGRAIALSPSDHIAYTNRGITLSKMGRTDDAIKDYGKACELGSQEGCEALRTYKLR